MILLRPSFQAQYEKRQQKREFHVHLSDII
jgi:hypothetical protein